MSDAADSGDGPDGPPEPLHSIGMVCRRTGLKSDRLRAWERRYNAVEPVRSEGNQRLYRERDIEKLLLLRRATDAGHRIARIARLAPAELRDLLEIDASAPALRAPRPLPGEADKADALVSRALSAIQQLDGEALREQLASALETLSPAAVTQQMLVPLIHAVGDLWTEGGLKAAHEHLGTAVLRTFIEGLREVRRIPATAPRLLVTTPATEKHELGALLAAATATDAGWHVTYLGPDLPAVEIALAGRQRGVRVIGLSIVRPAAPEIVDGELRALRRQVGDAMGLILGGRAAPAYEETATEIGAVVVQDLIGLAPALSLFA
jgi:DNA-binding transcriptional MerR regulator/methylmalonyl-CoA mutase cobalamin-binding subunit